MRAAGRGIAARWSTISRALLMDEPFVCVGGPLLTREKKKLGLDLLRMTTTSKSPFTVSRTAWRRAEGFLL